MKTRTTLALATLISLGMLATTGCTADDDLRRPHTGTQLLQLGEVTVQGAQTARTATTRAITTEDTKTGFIGIRKTKFVETDELNLTLTAPNGSGGTTDTPVTATLGANGWTLADRTYYTPGTTLTATYTPATQQDGSNPGGLKYADELTATVDPLPVNGSKLSLTLTHANALVEVTPPAGITYTDLTVTAIPDGSGAPTPAAQELGTSKEEDAGSIIRHRTIARAGSALQSISLKVNGMTYTTALTQKVEANKRYPITLSITKDKLVATVGASDLNWGTPEGFDGRPGGYTRYIYTADDLAAFSTAVNSGDTKATTATVLQMADIDLTGREWTPIGTAAYPFRGNYNGNGHTISNLKIDQGNSSNLRDLGLFGRIQEAKITGVHLRNCTIKSTTTNTIYAGTLAGYCMSSIVTLCSATGTVNISSFTSYIGGMIGYSSPNNNATPSYITRCSADVTVIQTATNGGYVGGFVGYTHTTYYAGCISSGTMTNNNGKGGGGGFSSTNVTTVNFHAFGCIANSAVNGVNSKYAFGSTASVKACLSTQADIAFHSNSVNTSVDNASVSSTTGTGVTHSIDPAAAYAALTKTDAASTAPIKTLHYSKEEGYTLDVVERKWYAVDAWKDNTGALPTLNMNYQGTPEPVKAGNTIYRVNGYYVTAPAAATDTYVWNADTSADAMASNPCATTTAIANGWRLPTMKDFEAMAGWSANYPWSESAGVGNENLHNVADAINFINAFPTGKNYWSSVPYTQGATTAWCLAVRGTAPQAVYSRADKSTNANNYIRCVQKIIP